MTLHLNTIRCADALTYLRTLPDGCVNCIVTSPPYLGLRDYATDGQIGAETTPSEYVAALVEVFREARRVLRNDGVLWLNIADSFAGSGKGRNADGTHSKGGKKQSTNVGSTAGLVHKTNTKLPPKSLFGIPWRVAFALQDDDWVFRADIIWAKPNPMPSPVKDRPTVAHEYVFLFSKKPKYWYDAQAVAEKTVSDRVRGPVLHPDLVSTNGNSGLARRPIEPTRNRRSVWTIVPANFRGAHFATMPEELAEICIKAGCPEGGVVLDPFMGAGTTGLVAHRLNRNFIGCDLNAEYVEMALNRIYGPMFASQHRDEEEAEQLK